MSQFFESDTPKCEEEGFVYSDDMYSESYGNRIKDVRKGCI